MYTDRRHCCPPVPLLLHRLRRCRVVYRPPEPVFVCLVSALLRTATSHDRVSLNLVNLWPLFEDDRGEMREAAR